uniref:Uncharacterized protein n=1 Tax=uncultured Bacillota bacterium TaxID=344338 RepID=A0A650F4N2_9FIRM|nr:hypothetical protein Firmicute1046_1410 [uncultured Firmicutes bacterium]
MENIRNLTHGVSSKNSKPIVPIVYEKPKDTESTPIEFYNSKEECAKAIGLNDDISQSASSNQNLIEPIIWEAEAEETMAIDISANIVGANQDISKEEPENRTTINLMEFLGINRNDDSATTETKRGQVAELACTGLEEAETPTTNSRHLKQNIWGEISSDKKCLFRSQGLSNLYRHVIKINQRLVKPLKRLCKKFILLT